MLTKSNRSRSFLETLESRRLLSVTVPDDYVLVQGDIAVDSDGTPTQTGIMLDSGANYFVKATGTYTIAPGRLADAEFMQEKSPGTPWIKGVKGRPLVAGVTDWGNTRDTSTTPEYGGFFTGIPAAGEGATGNEFTPRLNDSYYNDNAGGLMVELYQQVVLNSLTVTEASDTSNTVTDTDGPITDDTIYLLTDSANQATVNLSAAFTPASSEAGAKVLWQVFDESNNPVSGLSGDFGGTNPAVTLTFPNVEEVFQIGAGVDMDGNGILSGNEYSRSVRLAQKFKLNVGPKSTRVIYGDVTPDPRFIGIQFVSGSGSVTIKYRDGDVEKTVTRAYDANPPTGDSFGFSGDLIEVTVITNTETSLEWTISKEP